MYKKKAHIHFVGIGGIGMSGIATILRLQGYTISGCDVDTQQQNIIDLEALGCVVYEGNNIFACANDDIDIVVYSSAIKQTDPEIVRAQKRGIPTINRALMLAELMRTKYSIAIAGMHGKTTTTSLISHILIEAKKDPTIIIGGHLKNISAHARFGNGDFLVAEADESDRSLISLHATLAVITNIDLEHLETYKDLDDIKHTFKQFLNNLPFYGKAIVCVDDPHIQSILPMPHIKLIRYGIEQHADLWAEDITLGIDHSTFTVCTPKEKLGMVRLNMPGRHNILNALAAIVLALDLEVSFDIVSQALAHFKGVDRRFSFRGMYQGAEVFDDYGHHPVEIKNTVLIARKRTQGKLIMVFQPHRFTRTQKLWDQFIDMFLSAEIDHLIITDIYPASEAAIPEITASHFAAALQHKQPHCTVSYVPYATDFHEIVKDLEKLVHKRDLVLLQGAGKINKLAGYLCSKSE